MTGFGEIDQNDCFLGQNGLILTFLAPKWGKRDFFWEKAKCHFRTLIMLQLCGRNQNC